MGKVYYRTPRTSRTPKDYDGTAVTTHQMKHLIPQVLSHIDTVYYQQSNLVLEGWSEIIGSKLAHMTQALSFIDGILVVKVKNSTLHSLINQEKPRLLQMLREKFPATKIRTISFRIG